ncbi:MAG TPA: hypothetical protein VNH84_15110, partial [Candidatus Saccharimonadales bacterium]|nr:hypothetical protein [Candidatus Saccharimonadales bacterium]
MKFLSALLGLMLVLAAALPARADDPLAVLVRLLGQKDDPRFQLDLLRGMSDGLKGQRSVPMPAGWEAVETRLAASSDPAVRSLAQTLSLTFGSERARKELRQTLNDEQAPAAARRTALDALVGIKDA